MQGSSPRLSGRATLAPVRSRASFAPAALLQNVFLVCENGERVIKVSSCSVRRALCTCWGGQAAGAAAAAQAAAQGTAHIKCFPALLPAQIGDFGSARSAIPEGYQWAEQVGCGAG